MADGFLEDLKVSPATTWTEELRCIHGQYKWLNGVPLHYFNTNITIPFLHTSVRLMSDMVGIEKWSFEALFQRNISPQRVDEIHEKYLANPARFKFFPPVTLALLPAVDGKLRSEYGSASFAEQKQGKHVFWEMSGVRIDFFVGDSGITEVGQIASLSWDKTVLTAVALDGQHRIAALRKFRGPDDPAAREFDVPATFLLFDPTPPDSKHLLNLVREIFVDVNHTAKSVDESRIILLDDQDFVRRAARSCVLHAFSDNGQSNVPEWEPLDATVDLNVLPGIPQELVDLRLGRQGAGLTNLREWQFVSIYTLYRILLAFYFKNSWETFELELETQQLTASDGDVGACFEVKRVENKEASGIDATIFCFPPAVGKQLLEKQFRDRVQPVLMGVFTAIAPYKSLLEAALAGFNDAANGSSVREFLIAENDVPKDCESALLRNWKEHKPELLVAVQGIRKLICKPADFEEDLMWYGVTQRALFVEVGSVRKALECFAATGQPKTTRHFVKSYIDAINTLWQGDVFRRDYKVDGKRLWLGAPLVEEAGQVKVRPSDASAKRMGKLIRLLVAAVQAKAAGRSLSQFNEDTVKRSSGLKGSISTVAKVQERNLQTQDIAKGTTRTPEAYKKAAAARVLSILKKAVFDCDAVPGPQETGAETN